MRYEKEKCPVCGEVFTENDEVVVCPECGAPHHRSCYSENGHCANEHLHAEGFVWKKAEPEVQKTEENKTENPSETAESETSICPDCGAENKKKAFVCTSCGAVLIPEMFEEIEPTPKKTTVFIDGQPVDDNDHIDEEKTVTVKEAASFIQTGKENYIKAFLDAKVNHRKPKFNIWAFLLGAYWFFFRKMYKPGFVFAGINFAINCFRMTFFMQIAGEAMKFILENQNAFASGKADEALYNQYFTLLEKGMESHQTEMILMIVFALLPVIVNIFAGIFANKLYLNHIKSTIAKIKSVVPNPSAHLTYIYAKGGTTILNTFLLGMMIYYLTNIIFSQALM